MRTYKIAPCRDCKNRCVGCHGSCELYKEWKAEESRIHKQLLLKEYIGGIGYYHG